MTEDERQLAEYEEWLYRWQCAETEYYEWLWREQTSKVIFYIENGAGL